MARVIGRIAVASAVLLLVSCVPVVPVLQAPVVPDPIDRQTLVSLLQLLVSPFLMGIRLKATMMTLPVVIGLIAAGVFAARFLNRRIFGSPQSDPKH